jgi:hypothetical protein
MKNSSQVCALFNMATNRWASSTYAREETGFRIPPAIKGKACRGDVKGTIVPEGFIGSIFHHMRSIIAYRFAI